MWNRRSILFGPLPPPYGGVSIFMTALTPAVIERGAEVWAYTGKIKDDGNPRFLNHRRLVHLAALVRGGFRARITDSTHFHVEYPNKLLLPLWLVAKFVLRFRWIKIIHDGSLASRYTGFSRMSKWLCDLAMRNIDEFVVYDHKLEIWVRERIDTAVPVRFIPVMLPPPSNWGSEGLTEPLRTSLDNCRTRARQVCSVGVFIPSYGFGEVARAVEELRAETGEDIGLMLVDGGFARDDDFRTEVLSRRDWIEVAERVPNPMLPEIYRQSDVFVRAFEHESFGISRIEAMMCGVPVIATNVGETRGMLTYEFGDISTLKQHIAAVFVGKNAMDAGEWAKRFASEMDTNLKNHIAVVIGE